jgi:hypothetical protein
MKGFEKYLLLTYAYYEKNPYIKIKLLCSKINTKAIMVIINVV